MADHEIASLVDAYLAAERERDAAQTAFDHADVERQKAHNRLVNTLYTQRDGRNPYWVANDLIEARREALCCTTEADRG